MKLIILDRDGVINKDSADFVKSAEEFLPLAGSLAAIGRLCKAGWTVTVASNQSGVGRGLFELKDLHAMQVKLLSDLVEHGGHIEGFFYCPHSPRSNCDCRKPKAGLLQQIGERFGVDLQDVPVVGDSLRDLQAAWSAGARAMLVLTGNGKKTRSRLAAAADDSALHAQPEVFASLAEAADALLAEDHT